MRSVDMMGIGVQAELAKREGWPASAAVTAAGTTTADATVLLKYQRQVIMTATGSDGIRLPATAELMVPYMVTNTSGSTGKVYPPSAGTINGGSADAATSVTTLKTFIAWRYSSTGWAALMA